MQFLQGAGDIGLQGLGTLVRILDLAASAKRGNIGGSLLQQAMASQDPNARAAIEQSPFLAGFTGNYGGRVPVQGSPEELLRAGSPNLPQGVQLLGEGQTPQSLGTRFRADLPPLNPLAQAQLELEQAKVPYTQAQTPLLKAQTRQAQAEADFLSGGTGKLGNMRLTGARVGGFSFEDPTQRAPIRLQPGETVTGDLGGQPTINELGPEEKKKQEELGKLSAARETLGNPTLALIDQMIEATKILPGGIGGLAASKTGLTGAVNRFRLGTSSEGPTAEQLRTLRQGDLLIQQLYRLSAVGVATEQDVKPYADRLKGLEGMSEPEAKNRLLETRSYIISRLYGGKDPTTGARSTTTTSGTSTTSTTMPPTALSPEELDQHRRKVFGEPVQRLRRSVGGGG